MALAIRYGLPSGAPVVLKDGSNLLVHLAPAPVVLRIASFTALIRGAPLPWLEREVALVTYLASMGAAVMGPSDLIPPGPHVLDGWAMSAWRFVDHEPGREPDPVTTLHALDDLHIAMRGFPGDLPLLNPVTDDLDRVLRFGVARGVMAVGEVEDARRRRDGLVTRLITLVPTVQAQHGDAFARNTLVTSRGVVWIDFEDCCAAPVLWDLATMLRSRPDDRVRAIVRERHGSEALEIAIALRQLQVDAWTVLHDARSAHGW